MPGPRVVLIGDSIRMGYESFVRAERGDAAEGFDRFEADVAAYNEAAARVARDLRIPVHDLFSAVMRGGRDLLLTPDGVHFKPEGSQMLGRAVAAFVRPYLAERQTV